MGGGLLLLERSRYTCMDSTDITAWVGDHIPEVLLLIGGLLALVIVVCYVKDKESGKYKAMMALGVIFGAIMALEAVGFYGEWRTITSALVAISAFALIIRPFRDVHFAVIIALLVMVLAYLGLGGLEGYMLMDSVDLSFLAEGWPRIIVAFLIGAIVYMILNFAEALVKLVGKVLNWWPLLMILGIVCIAEAVCMLMGYGSISDYIDTSSITS